MLIPTDGLGQHNHDIWHPRVDEAAPIDQASAYRVDYEGPLIQYARILGKEAIEFYALMYAFVEQFYFTAFSVSLFWGFVVVIRDTDSCALYFATLYV
jgi:hypothetical protein